MNLGNQAGEGYSRLFPLCNRSLGQCHVHSHFSPSVQTLLFLPSVPLFASRFVSIQPFANSTPLHRQYKIQDERQYTFFSGKHSVAAATPQPVRAAESIIVGISAKGQRLI